jgi:hypothetical protein
MKLTASGDPTDLEPFQIAQLFCLRSIAVSLEAIARLLGSQCEQDTMSEKGFEGLIDTLNTHSVRERPDEAAIAVELPRYPWWKWKKHPTMPGYTVFASTHPSCTCGQHPDFFVKDKAVYRVEERKEAK